MFEYAAMGMLQCARIDYELILYLMAAKKAFLMVWGSIRASGMDSLHI